MKKEIIIAGAGLVGSLLSIYLAKRGYKVSIYEKRADMRKETMDAGRSINLALSDRGLLALEKVGLAEEIKEISIPMTGRYIHNIDGTTAFQPYGREGQYINSVSRAALNMKLIDHAEKHGIEIYFGKKCASVDWEKNTVTIEPTSSGSKSIASFDILFGSDGSFSTIRLQHQLQHHKFDYHQYYIDCGYKELTIPATASGDFAMKINALHIWPRRDYMLIALPNMDKTFTCTLFFPFEGETSFSKLDTPEKIEAFFEKTFPDAVSLMPDYVNEFLNNPTSSLVTIKCYPWVRDDKFGLIGDAAHAIVPFFGQGMNCGFEDCRILDELIDEYDHDWKTILQEFQVSRKPDADAIADLAVNNFTEMRERTADPKFLLQKKIEAWLHEKHPDKWIPAYSQVTFNPHIHFADAFRNAMKQEAIMRSVMTIQNIEERWRSEEIEKLILSKL
ncbi:MAG TPA: NAD(P)/FAD-dependent oxidoreductase [Chitinophagaceae bacterium]|nr:NAD(P)/FAD-dependent oxidoreductase [Chitinophagaceae bacterium]